MIFENFKQVDAPPSRSRNGFFSGFQTWHFILILAVAIASTEAGEPGNGAGGRRFIGFSSFANFKQAAGSEPGETVLTSPMLEAGIDFNEAIASWNAELAHDSYLTIEARALYGETSTRYYKLGLWSTDPSRHPRQSVANQKDAEGDVSTDVLILRRPAKQVQIRVTVGGNVSATATLKFLGISLTDSSARGSELAPNRQAWGKLIEVPERSQMAYPNGKVLCSPTTVSMLMSYWAQALKRPELDSDVPQIAAAIYDSQWQGTGNWPFNMAYAGSFPGMRAYVTRLSDISELEDWIAKGLPVGLSVDYDRLRDKGPGPNGHLVVLIGFTQDGDAIINDPGTSKHVRKTFSRKNLINAWACSHNTVYLVYPVDASLPLDRFGHWDSDLSRN
jgi:hypothetical protein